MKGRGKKDLKNQVSDSIEPEKTKEKIEQEIVMVDSSIDEVTIYSSSHFSDKRGLKKLLIELLGPQFQVTFRASGGRMWDSEVSHAYRVAQRENKGSQKLHVILLGDNDVRELTKLNCNEKRNWIPPMMKKLGKTIQDFRSEGKFKGDTVFVNGVLPFPIFGLKNTPKLISNFYRFTRALSSLVEFDPSIHYVPVRSQAYEFCKEKDIAIHELFKADRVHLNELGEGFVARHLVKQIKAFRCIKRLGNDAESLQFCNKIVNIENKDEIDKHFKIASDTDFFDVDLGKRRPAWLKRKKKNKTEKIDPIDVTICES